MMRTITAEDIDRVLTYPTLVEALREAFRAEIAAPVRHHHAIGNAMLLLMPAWSGGAEEGQSFLGCKIVTVFPDNGKIAKPAVLGSYVLMSGATGEPLAVMDGTSLTRWRTACASALAASYLARADATHLVMVGAGALAPYLVRAHAAVRPLKRVTLWNRTRGHAVQAAFALAVGGLEVEVVEDLEAAVRDADIVSCATLSTTPLLHGKWLKKGTHVDLVGGFTPKMREADDDAVKKARVYVDTQATLKEAGDLTQPIKNGILKKTGVRGDLFGLCRGKVKGRTRDSEITLFKSAGTAIEDLAAAMLVWRGLPA
jgi:ornithine cyclodeaminase/alanine dehydrogenase-like protein (mu-crystallin family)